MMVCPVWVLTLLFSCAVVALVLSAFLFVVLVCVETLLEVTASFSLAKDNTSASMYSQAVISKSKQRTAMNIVVLLIGLYLRV